MPSPPPPPAALQLQLGCSLHSVHPRPLRQDQVVISPFLFGSELNMTIFHELRRDVQSLMRESRNNPNWSFETHIEPGSVLILPSWGLASRSGTIKAVVRRICQYFSIDVASAKVGLAHRTPKPTCQYRRGTL
jgi:hypothetical protein